MGLSLVSVPFTLSFFGVCFHWWARVSNSPFCGSSETCSLETRTCLYDYRTSLGETQFHVWEKLVCAITSS